MAWFLRKSNSADKRLKIIVGLGNPGQKYRNNRHNIGFKIIDELSRQGNALFKRSFILKSLIAKAKIKENEIVLIKPVTFMNNSGLCVKKALAHYKAHKDNLLIVYDDADLPFGVLRLRKGGSSAGHNGMASIIDNLGSEEINRLRVGIGKPENKDLIGYVLSDFSQDESKELPQVLGAAVSACMDWVTQ
jgi:PTH1 family peptidyl-tRNA hydrolase